MNGINAQLSVPAEYFGRFKEHLDSIPFLKNVRLNVAIEQDNYAFLKLKIKVRHKIVADGLNDETFVSPILEYMLMQVDLMSL